MQQALERLRSFDEVQRRLRTPENLADLLSVATVEACRWCGFSRALIVSVDEDMLTSSVSEAIPESASDALRRQVRAEPIRAARGSLEAGLIRRDPDRGARKDGARSVLEQALGLDNYLVAPIVPDARVVALLVVDRPERPVDEGAHALVAAFAVSVGVALERHVLRARMRELAAEMRAVTASAQALVQEAVSAPVDLASDYGLGPVFTAARMYAPEASNVSDLLTPREQQIADLLIQGMSNPQIGEALHISRDTVKGHLAGLLRKLGAANRVEAAARYVLMLTGGRG